MNFKIGRLLIFTEELKEKDNIANEQQNMAAEADTYLIYECNGAALGDAKFDGSGSSFHQAHFLVTQYNHPLQNLIYH